MNIVYRAGGQHLNVDAMSRRTWELTDPPFPLVVEAVSEERASGGVMWGKGSRESSEENRLEEKKEERSERREHFLYVFIYFRVVRLLDLICNVVHDFEL